MADAPDAAITPTPDDDEAAAILAALAAYLAAQRHPAPTPTRAISRWALAGRLANQGLAPYRPPAPAIGWPQAGRKTGRKG